MNDNLSYYSVDVHTPAEIEGLSLRTPRPVAKRRQYGFICAKANNNMVLTVRKRSDSNMDLTVRKRSDSNMVFNCAKAKRQQHGF